jgi:hypothetical protein
MTTELQDAMTAGVFVEFHDDLGNTVGQAVFTGWQRRPLPAVGDVVRCAVRCASTGRRRKLAGRVLARHFELQHENGEACVWVRLALKTAASSPVRQPASAPASFSAN